MKGLLGGVGRREGVGRMGRRRRVIVIIVVVEIIAAAIDYTHIRDYIRRCCRNSPDSHGHK